MANKMELTDLHIFQDRLKATTDAFTKKIAGRIQKRARTLAPKGETGKLADGIVVERGSERGIWFVSTTVPYSFWIINGKRTDPRSGVVYAQAGPRPFLQQAVRDVV